MKKKVEKPKTKEDKYFFWGNIPSKERGMIREKLLKLKEGFKSQNEKFSELFLFPNEIGMKALDDFISGRISKEILFKVMASRIKRYNEIFNLNLKGMIVKEEKNGKN